MIRLFKILSYSVLVLIISLLIYINIKLHSSPNLENYEKTKSDVVLQLKFLNEQLKQHSLGEKMQQLYPEGFVFINTLYGLTWAEVAKGENQDSKLYNQALNEARYAYKEVNSDVARYNFDIKLTPTYGIFYRGWKNYLLAKILEIQNDKDSLEIAEFKANCDDIAIAISNNKSPYLESYWKSSWPADAFVAVASLKLYDNMFNPLYEKTINDWILNVKTKLDSETNLIPHSTDSDSGEKKEGTRGSSISLMLIFLSDINPEFAEQQFKLYKDKFLITRFQLPAIREYPVGKSGQGDIDSGPVIFDIGFAGTIVSIGTFKKFGEFNVANKISNCIDGFGFPINTEVGKKYLFGAMPISDAFIAWSRIQKPNEIIINDVGKNNEETGSILMFHIYSILFVAIIFIIVFRRKLKSLF